MIEVVCDIISAALLALACEARGATVTGRKLVVSSIYLWYEADFGGSETGVIAHLKRYARPELASARAIIDHISGDSYDGALNDLRR